MSEAWGVQELVPGPLGHVSAQDLNKVLERNLYAANATVKQLGLELVLRDREIAGKCKHLRADCKRMSWKGQYPDAALDHHNKACS